MTIGSVSPTRVSLAVGMADELEAKGLMVSTNSIFVTVFTPDRSKTIIEVFFYAKVIEVSFTFYTKSSNAFASPKTVKTYFNYEDPKFWCEIMNFVDDYRSALNNAGYVSIDQLTKLCTLTK